MADALILCGGVAKGAFTAGALEVLVREHGRDLDLRTIVAASSGALNGVHLAAALRRGDAFERAAELVSLWVEHGTFGDAFSVSLPSILRLEGVSTSDKLLAFIRQNLQPTAGGGPIDLRLVVTATQGKIDTSAGPPETTFEHVLQFKDADFDAGPRHEELVRSVAASAALPLAYVPVTLTIDGRQVPCYDGGLVDNAPIKSAIDDPQVTRVFVVAPFPAVAPVVPSEARGLGLLMHLADVLINERLYRDLQMARGVNATLGRLAALPAPTRDAALDALGWRGRRVLDVIEIRPRAALPGNAFDGFFSRDLRERYVWAGRQAARRALGGEAL